MLNLSRILNNTVLDFKGWITWAFEIYSPVQRKLFCTLWAILIDRNTCVHEKRVSLSHRIAHFVQSYIVELDGIQRRKLSKRSSTVTSKKPIGSTIKINFDRAYNVSTSISLVGIVARNSEGRVLISSSWISENTPLSSAAEAIAWLKAVQMGIEKGWSDIIIEGDASTIIKMLI